MQNSRSAALLAALTVLGAVAQESASSCAAELPNIVLIYADDVGFGDVGCYGATGVPTPNIDRLAREGCRFTDGHSPAATCTPSRYALLTGEYAWRKKGTGIAAGDATSIIEPGRLTVASMLQRAGYRTGVVGKWHLGLGSGEIDWNQRISPSPLDIGFNESFIMPATGDRVPCVYVADDRVVGLDPADPIRVSFREAVGDEPTGLSHPHLLKMEWDHGHNGTIINGISRIGFMSGGKNARWVDEDMADVFTEQAVRFIDRHRATYSGQPFFLCFHAHDIHVPRVPHRRFVGATSMGPRGDVLVELDWCVGRILNCLEVHGIQNDTLVIFTSDNGGVLNDGYKDQAVEKAGNHRPSGILRGGKYSAFEGGTRVPFLTRWPSRIQAGVTSNALVCQIDFLRSFASLTQQVVPVGDGIDSIDTMNAFLGTETRGRDTLVLQAGVLSLRSGNWKYIEPGKGPAISKSVNIETGNDVNVQLYDLQSDPGETRNLADQFPDRVRGMQEKLDRIRTQGTIQR